MHSPARLNIITGKGGVGKTQFAQAYTKSLELSGHKVLYAYIATTDINEKTIQKEELSYSIQTLPLILSESIESYVSLKLKSKVIGNLVSRASFFKSLISMMPGFNYLIYLGQMLQMLEEDPQLTIVFDSPASGHAITMMNATENFSHIFRSGLIFNDTKKMLQRLYSKEFTQLFILTLPSLMSAQESLELQSEIVKINTNIETKLLFNNVLSSTLLSEKNLPDFLQKKIEGQQEVLKKYEMIKLQVPQFQDETELQKLLPTHISRILT